MKYHSIASLLKSLKGQWSLLVEAVAMGKLGEEEGGGVGRRGSQTLPGAPSAGSGRKHKPAPAFPSGVWGGRFSLLLLFTAFE